MTRDRMQSVNVSALFVTALRTACDAVLAGHWCGSDNHLVHRISIAEAPCSDAWMTAAMAEIYAEFGRGSRLEAALPDILQEVAKHLVYAVDMQALTSQLKEAWELRRDSPFVRPDGSDASLGPSDYDEVRI